MERPPLSNSMQKRPGFKQIAPLSSATTSSLKRNSYYPSIEVENFHKLDDLNKISDDLEKESVFYRALLYLDCAKYLAKSRQEKLKSNIINNTLKESKEHSDTFLAKVYKSRQDRDFHLDIFRETINTRSNLAYDKKNKARSLHEIEFDLQQNTLALKKAKYKLEEAEENLKVALHNQSEYEISLLTLQQHNPDTMEGAFTSLANALGNLEKLPATDDIGEMLENYKESKEKINFYTSQAQKMAREKKRMNKRSTNMDIESQDESWIGDLDRDLFGAPKATTYEDDEPGEDDDSDDDNNQSPEEALLIP